MKQKKGTKNFDSKLKFLENLRKQYTYFCRQINWEQVYATGIKTDYAAERAGDKVQRSVRLS